MFFPKVLFLHGFTFIYCLSFAVVPYCLTPGRSYFLPSLKFGKPVQTGRFHKLPIALGIRTTRPQWFWVWFGLRVVIFPFFLDDRTLCADSSLKYCILSSVTSGENKIYSVSHLHVFSRSHHLFGSPRSQQLVSQKALSY